MAEAITVDVDGHPVRLSNLAKVLYPRSGFTKGEVVDYYRQIAAVMLPHLAGKPCTRVRCPDGIADPEAEKARRKISFYEKNPPSGAPDWFRTGLVLGSDAHVNYPIVDDLATLLVLANLASLELHVPQWRFDQPDPTANLDPQAADHPQVETLVVDLDPGTDLPFAKVVLAAQLVGGLLTTDQLIPHVRSSGGNGLQVYVAIEPADAAAVTTYCRSLATRLGQIQPDLFTLNISRAGRTRKVLVDANQNQPGRNTIAPYSLRAREVDAGPTVAAPLDWAELDGVTDRREILFTPAEILERVAAEGDLAADLLPGAPRDSLPPVSDTD